MTDSAIMDLDTEFLMDSLATAWVADHEIGYPETVNARKAALRVRIRQLIRNARPSPPLSDTGDSK